MVINNILGQSAFWIVNKKLASIIGLEEAILLSDLISKQKYFYDNNELCDGFFFNTSSNITKDTGLSYSKQKRIITTLTKNNLISVALLGVPAKLHFKIHDNNIQLLLGLDEDVIYEEVKPKDDNSDIAKESIQMIYDAYPVKCVIRGASTGKGSKNKKSIAVLLKRHTKEHLLEVIKWYVSDCKKNNVYMKNFSTFLNNLPDLVVEPKLTSNKKQIKEILRWLSINYSTKKADKQSNDKVNMLIDLGYTNNDFLNRYKYE